MNTCVSKQLISQQKLSDVTTAYSKPCNIECNCIYTSNSNPNQGAGGITTSYTSSKTCRRRVVKWAFSYLVTDTCGPCAKSYVTVEYFTTDNTECDSCQQKGAACDGVTPPPNTSVSPNLSKCKEV